MLSLVTTPLKLFCDNSGALAKTNYKKQKHMKRKYHLIREIVQRCDIEVTQIASEQNFADPFIKAILRKPFNMHLECIDMCELSHMLWELMRDWCDYVLSKAYWFIYL